VLLVGVHGAAWAGVETPLAWQDKTNERESDADGNGVEDLIDEMEDGTRIDVLVLLTRCLEDEHRERLEEVGELGFQSSYLSFVALKDVVKEDAVALAQEEFVWQVALDAEAEVGLNISNPAIKVRWSGAYPKENVDTAFPGTDGRGVTIAILDSGCDDHLHESLPLAIGGYDALTNREINPDDENGHGTHVAGIALGRGGPGRGFIGIARGANLVDVKVIGANGRGNISTILRGLEWTIRNRNRFNIRVINMSLGVCQHSIGRDVWSQLTNIAVARGISVACCAFNTGNCGLGDNAHLVCAPAAADFAMSVAAAGYAPIGRGAPTINRRDDTIAKFSLIGPRLDGGLKPDVTAHGTDHPAPIANDGIKSAEHNTANEYVRFVGTSMASPHVAGVAALIIQCRPNISPFQVKAAILSQAEGRRERGDGWFHPIWSRFWGWGLVDAFKAVDCVCNDVCKPDLLFDDNTTAPFPRNVFSRDLYTSNPRIVAGVWNRINARVHNVVPPGCRPEDAKDATNVRVQIGIYITGNNPGMYFLCERIIPLIRANSYVTVSCPWRPGVYGPGAVTHGCLKARILYPCDADFSNNDAQRNVDIQNTVIRATPEPLEFRMLVENYTETDFPRVEIRATPEPPDPWELDLLIDGEPYAPFPFNELDCPKVLTALLDPRDATRGAVTVNIEVVGIDDEGEEHSLGGGVITGQIPDYQVAGGGSFEQDGKVSVVRIELEGSGDPNTPPGTFRDTEDVLGELQVYDYATNTKIETTLLTPPGEDDEVTGADTGDERTVSGVAVEALVTRDGEETPNVLIDFLLTESGGVVSYEVRDHATQELMVGGTGRPGRASLAVTIIGAAPSPSPSPAPNPIPLPRPGPTP
jgi:subtilisin family serine protease